MGTSKKKRKERGEGAIYLIYCKITNKMYIGSTFDTHQRLQGHTRSDNGCKSEIIVGNCFYDYITLYTRYAYSKQELTHYENKIIRAYKKIYGDSVVNVRGSVPREIQRRNSNKKYDEANKEKIHKQKKEYYEKNKGKILERQKKYREENKEKKKKQDHEYYLKKKLRKAQNNN